MPAIQNLGVLKIEKTRNQKPQQNAEVISNQSFTPHKLPKPFDEPNSLSSETSPQQPDHRTIAPILLSLYDRYVMSTVAHITTAEQLFATNLQHCELIGGELVMMSPAGFDHGRFASRIVAALENHVARQRLGIVTTAEAGFQLATDPDTVRAPDVAFVRADRIPPEGVKGYFQGAPDLAVEVVSPSDRPSEIAAKVQDWLHAGCSMVWVVEPGNRTVAIHRPGNQVTIVTTADTITGSDLLPGFSMPVARVFS